MNIFISCAAMLLLLATFLRAQCPSSCTCELNGAGKNYVSCKNLNEQPFNIPTTTQVLLINDGNLKILKADAFKNLSRLEEIRITGTELQEIEPYLFNGLSYLKNVLIYRNNIKSISRNSFNNLTSLQKLDLSFNDIETLEEGTFGNLANLTHIYLAYNKITHLNNYMFKGSIKLNTIAMSRNNIKSIARNSFNNLPSLQNLDLSANDIDTLEEETFSNLKNLTHLSLIQNKLTHINNYMFKGLINLKKLMLQHNKIAEIFYNGPFNPHLISIALNGNPLNFSCNTFASLSNMLNHGIYIDSDTDTTYKSPSWLDSVKIRLINETRINVPCQSNYLCFNMSVGCSNVRGMKTCFNINKSINCACAVKSQSKTLTCSNCFDCRTYGCINDSICSLIQQQWKCSENVSLYVCNNTECKNNRQCVPVNQTFTCPCKTGSSGETCEQDTGLETKYIVLIVILIIMTIAVLLILCCFFKRRKTNTPTDEQTKMNDRNSNDK